MNWLTHHPGIPSFLEGFFQGADRPDTQPRGPLLQVVYLTSVPETVRLVVSFLRIDILCAFELILHIDSNNTMCDVVVFIERIFLSPGWVWSR